VEYQINYNWLLIAPGTFSVDEQTLRLKGYSAARQKQRRTIILLLIWGIWIILWQKIESLLRVYLGLPSGELWADFVAVGVSFAPLILGLLAVWLWPISSTPEEFETRFVTGIKRWGKKVSFDFLTSSETVKYPRVTFLANSIEEAEAIELALRISKEAALEGRQLSGSPGTKWDIPSGASISPDVKRDILSGKLSEKEILAEYGVPAKQLRDILSGEFSEREVMIRYAMRPEDLEEMYEMLALRMDVVRPEFNEAISIAPDVERDILSGQLSKQEIMIKYAIRAEELEEMCKIVAGKPQLECGDGMTVPPDVERDILSGRLSKRDIMVKYAIRAEEIEEMYKILAAKL
jgi:hypothetical protein